MINKYLNICWAMCLNLTSDYARSLEHNYLCKRNIWKRKIELTCCNQISTDLTHTNEWPIAAMYRNRSLSITYTSNQHLILSVLVHLKSLLVKCCYDGAFSSWLLQRLFEHGTDLSITYSGSWPKKLKLFLS